MEEPSNQLVDRQASIKLNDQNGLIISCKYDLSTDKYINFLYDYSNLLSKNRIIDYKIQPWQSEKSELIGKDNSQRILQYQKQNNIQNEEEVYKYYLKLSQKMSFLNLM